MVIEGLDGAGKRTLANGLEQELGRRGRSVTRAAFPRYAQDVHAELVAEALHGSASDDIPRLMDTLATEIEAVWTVHPKLALLSVSSPHFEF